MGQLSEACNSRGGWFLKQFVFSGMYGLKTIATSGGQQPAEVWE